MGRKAYETMIKAMFLFSRKFHLRTYMHNLDGSRHGSVGKSLLRK